MERFRVIPVVALVGVALLFLKTLGLMTDDGYLFRGKASAENIGTSVEPPALTQKTPEKTLPSSDLNAQNDQVKAARERAISSEDTLREVNKADADQQAQTRALFSNDVASMLDEEDAKDTITFFDPITQKVYEVGRDEITASLDEQGEVDDKSGETEVSEVTSEDDVNDPDAPPRDVLIERNSNKVSNPADGTEQKLLSRLRERSALIKKSEEGLRLRELALEAVEKRLDDKIAELKSLELQVKSMIEAKDEESEARINDLVEIYSKMKSKAAARIFDQLGSEEIIDVVVKMQPRTLSSILALMDANKARELTLLMLGESRKLKPKPTIAQDTLPRIDGLPIEATSGIQ